MKSKNRKTAVQEERTPIIDGDTRPDHQEDALNAGRNKPAGRRGKKKLTTERGADTNSLEDFKDAK